MINKIGFAVPFKLGVLFQREIELLKRRITEERQKLGDKSIIQVTTLTTNEDAY